MCYFGFVEAGFVVVVLGEVVLDGLAGTAGVLGVTAVPFGVVAVEFGVVAVPVVEVVDAPVLDDCGTADPLAGTQFAVAVVEVLGVVLAVALGEVEEVVELLLGDALLVEADGEVVLAVELGDALVELLGRVLLVEVLGVEVVVLIDPVALALVLGTMPAGQLLVEEALGGVALGLVVVDVPLCDDDGIVLVPDCEAAGAELEVEGVVDVVLVVDVVCAATHVALAVKITTNASFFMFFCPRISSGSQCDAHT